MLKPFSQFLSLTILGLVSAQAFAQEIRIQKGYQPIVRELRGIRVENVEKVFVRLSALHRPTCNGGFLNIISLKKMVELPLDQNEVASREEYDIDAQILGSLMNCPSDERGPEKKLVSEPIELLAVEKDAYDADYNVIGKKKVVRVDLFIPKGFEVEVSTEK